MTTCTDHGTCYFSKLPTVNNSFTDLKLQHIFNSYTKKLQYLCKFWEQFSAEVFNPVSRDPLSTMI